MAGIKYVSNPAAPETGTFHHPSANTPRGMISSRNSIVFSSSTNKLRSPTMDGPSRLNSDLSLSPPRTSSYFPPYKSEEEEHEEEDAGATLTRLQHIANQRLFLFGNNKSCRQPRPRSRTGHLRSRLKHLLFSVSAVPLVSLFLGAFVIGGVVGYYTHGSYAQGRDVVESCRSTSTAGSGGGQKVLKLAGELNGLVPDCSSYPRPFFFIIFQDGVYTCANFSSSF